MSRHNKTQTCAKWQKRNSLQKLKQKSLCCEAGDPINKLCVGQATKSLGESTWDAAVHQVKPAVNEK